MSSKMIPFLFESQSVRVILIDETPWWVATDVAEILGYRCAADMTRNLDDDDIGKHVMHSKSKTGIEQDREMTIINMVGLCSAILNGNKQRAKAKAFLKGLIAMAKMDASNILDMFADLDVPDPEEYFVYAAQEVETGRIKIGISKNPERRVRTLNTGNSRDLRLIHAVPAPNCFDDERLAHGRATGWIRGEWFACTEQQAIENLSEVAA